MSNYQYFVCLYGKNGKEFYTLKVFESLQGARKYAKKKADSVRWGMLFSKGLAIRIYKHDKATGQPVTIYLN